jgi:methylated-DNA-[protein]-cysteine S-methyltransferase
VRQHRYVVPGWGTGEVWTEDGVLVLHDLAGSLPPQAAPRRRATAPADGLGPDLCLRFEQHLRGTPTSYDDVEVDEPGLTPFQRELLLALRSVPWGEVVSYGELAALAGRPRAARAAGTFCAGNQWSLVVPCHRVVSGDGIGGYGPSGVALKRRLLALEGIEL